MEIFPPDNGEKIGKIKKIESGDSGSYLLSAGKGNYGKNKT